MICAEIPNIGIKQNKASLSLFQLTLETIGSTSAMGMTEHDGNADTLLIPLDHGLSVSLKINLYEM